MRVRENDAIANVGLAPTAEMRLLNKTTFTTMARDKRPCNAQQSALQTLEKTSTLRNTYYRIKQTEEQSMNEIVVDCEEI